jgi:hypothetical protein
MRNPLAALTVKTQTMAMTENIRMPAFITRLSVA